MVVIFWLHSSVRNLLDCHLSKRNPAHRHPFAISGRGHLSFQFVSPGPTPGATEERQQRRTNAGVLTQIRVWSPPLGLARGAATDRGPGGGRRRSNHEALAARRRRGDVCGALPAVAAPASDSHLAGGHCGSGVAFGGRAGSPLVD